MHPSTTTILLIISITIILLLLPQTEAGSSSSSLQRGRRRPPHHHKHPLPPLKKRPHPKRKSRLSSLFSGVVGKKGGRRRKLPRKELMEGGESKNSVFYYPVHRTTEKPRIILGDELNFLDLGILQQQTDPNTKPQPLPPSLKSALIEQELTDYDHPQPQNPPSRRQKSPQPLPRRHPKHTGPGYRLRDSWQDHYVLEHNKPNRPHKNPHPPVMHSVMRAAGELRNAYKGAVIQSAKVAKYTGSAIGKYFKGVRNIFGGEESYNRKNSDSALEIPSTDSPVPPQKQEVMLEHEPQEALSTPNVYLDWGGSFWKYFYNKSNKMPGGSSLSEIEKVVV